MSLSRLLKKSPQEIKTMSSSDIEKLYSEKTTERNKNLGTPEAFSIVTPISIGIIAGSSVYLLKHFS
jgi:hypothetical protein